jgi:signal peptidase I
LSLAVGVLRAVVPRCHRLVTEEVPMDSKPSSRRSRIVTGLLVVVGVVVCMIGITIRVADLHFQTVLSNFMQPTASAGDVAITQAVPIDLLRVGDAITFIPPNRSGAVLHRITSLDDGAITTRGDANAVEDTWRLVLQGPIGYRLVAVVPFAGWLTQLKGPALLLAGLLIGLSIVLELRKEVLVRVTRSRPQPDS